MSDDKHQRIRDRAYALWEKEGKPEGRHLDHWHAAEHAHAEEENGSDPAATDSAATDSANEGEGNRTAAIAYDKHATEFAKSGKVKAKAREAKQALEGPEAASLQEAEEIGRSHAKGEDPLLAG